FFFQAEDGIRDPLVTGVQTCALPILTKGRVTVEVATANATIAIVRVDSPGISKRLYGPFPKTIDVDSHGWKLVATKQGFQDFVRSEERRVGEECSVWMEAGAVNKKGG